MYKHDKSDSIIVYLVVLYNTFDWKSVAHVKLLTGIVVAILHVFNAKNCHKQVSDSFSDVLVKTGFYHQKPKPAGSDISLCSKYQ